MSLWFHENVTLVYPFYERAISQNNISLLFICERNFRLIHSKHCLTFKTNTSFFLLNKKHHLQKVFEKWQTCRTLAAVCGLFPNHFLLPYQISSLLLDKLHKLWQVRKASLKFLIHHRIVVVTDRLACYFLLSFYKWCFLL